MDLNREIHLPAFVHWPRTMLGRAFAFALAYEAVMYPIALLLMPHLNMHDDAPLNVVGVLWVILALSPGLWLGKLPDSWPEWQVGGVLVAVNVIAVTALAWAVLRWRRRATSA